MNKRELEADMRRFVGNDGGFITISGIANYLGVRSHHSVDKYVNGLDRLNGKYYFIPDVAESMLRTGGVK